MKSTLPIVLMMSLPLVAVLTADEIVFKSGKKIEGKVLEYNDGRIKIRNSEGKVIVGDIEKIESITFESASSEEVTDKKDNKPNNASKPPEKPAAIPSNPNVGLSQKSIEMQLATIIANTEKSLQPNQAAFAIYLETEDPKAQIPQGGRIEYKCYGPGGGYSGVVSVPLRQAWTRNEYINVGSDNGSRRVELDPGPPYENITLTDVLVPGKVTNLGRVVLKKVIYEGTASVTGIVTTEDGNPIEGAIVSAGKRSVMTDKEGMYKLDGFGLEKVQLMVKKPGFFAEQDYWNVVSIRNMDQRTITKNLKLFVPKIVKFKYVISDEDSSSFVGPGTEKGTIELELDSSRFDLRGEKYTANFKTFVDNFQCGIAYQLDAWIINCFYGPMFVRGSNPNETFESIESVEEFGYEKQRCPPLKEGQVILIRGFPMPGQKGVSRYCVKILVEEFRDK